MLCQFFLKSLVCLLRQQLAQLVEFDKILDLNKIESQICRNYLRIQILSAAGDIVLRTTFLHLSDHLLIVRFQIHISLKMQIDGIEPVLYRLEQLLVRQIVLDMHLCRIQQIRQLAVLTESFARSRYYNIFDVLISGDDVLQLCQLDAISDR